MAFQDVERTVSAWSQQHPEFCSLLVDIAEARINHADDVAVRCDVDDPRADEEERDTELRKPGYGIAQRVLLLAEKLDPASLRIERLLATTELIFGPYESAYRRLTHVINSTPWETDLDLADQFFCKKLRGRVGCLWVERDRKLGKESGSETIAFLAKAQEDLEFCDRYLRLKGFLVGHPIKRYYVHHDQARILLAMAEAEIDLGKCDDAKKHLSESQKLINQMNNDRTGRAPSTETRHPDEEVQRKLRPAGLS